MAKFAARSSVHKGALAIAVLLSLGAAGGCSHPASGAPGPGPAGEPGATPPPAVVLLDDNALKRLREQTKQSDSGITRAIRDCEGAGSDRSAGFQGERFARIASSCAIGYRVTARADLAKTGVVFFKALLSDYQMVGDGKGGADVVTHDTGYAMRFFATYAALAYDWLDGAPGMTPELRNLARTRFSEWSKYYREQGYLRDVPGANYHAGYLVAVAMIAAVLEPGDALGDELAGFVSQELIGRGLAEAAGPGGVLEGGDWPEGWQYGALSVAHYGMAIRAMRGRGVSAKPFESWAASLVERYAHGLLPDKKWMHVGGDTGEETPYLEPSGRILVAAILTSEDPAVHAAARAELDAIHYADTTLPVLEALADALALPGTARDVRKDRFYLAAGTQRVFARTSWGADAVWWTTSCGPARVPDHQHFDAGNFELVRGSDTLVMDPSPYGSLSSLTGNAPTVSSPQLPRDYRPSQGPWGLATQFTSAKSTSWGVVVTRCSYADQYRFKNSPPDVKSATRSLVWIGGPDRGALVIWDDAAVSDKRAMQIRFRSPAKLIDTGKGARAKAGPSGLRIVRLAPAAATSSVSKLPVGGKCWEGPRGQCTASRHPGTQLAVAIPAARGPLVHALVVGPDDVGQVKGRFDKTRGAEVVHLDDPALAIIRPRGKGGGSIDGPRTGTYLFFESAVPANLELKATANGCSVVVPAAGARGGAVAVRVEGCRVVKREELAPMAATEGAKKAAREDKKRGCHGCSGAGRSHWGWLALALAIGQVSLRRAWRSAS